MTEIQAKTDRFYSRPVNEFEHMQIKAGMFPDHIVKRTTSSIFYTLLYSEVYLP